METQNTYRSFNAEKSIEELQYNMLQHKAILEAFNTEYSFFQYLLKSTIYKNNVINLFETLEDYKNEITYLKKRTENLIIKVKVQASKITEKLECNDLACDNYFIKEHDDLEQEIHGFVIKYTNFKSNMFQYLQSVIKH